MNDYEEKQKARRERLEARAQAALTESSRVYNRAHAMAGCIPFGQPILVGHHSERRDRNFRGRIHNTFGKAFALQDKADYYATKAAGVGTGGISSDDPAAVEKLRAELVQLEATQEHMKAANKLVKKGDRAGLAVLLGSDDAAANLFAKDFAGRVGFPSYRLTNNNANIRRIKERIETLEANSKRTDVEQVCDGYTYREDTAENRVMFEFNGKPAEAIRTLLKSHAFKWSPSRGAWVRMLNNSGLYAAKSVKEGLAAIKSKEA